MDALSRRGRLLLRPWTAPLPVLLALWGCRPPASGTPVGTSTTSPVAETTNRGDGGRSPANVIPGDFRSTFAKVNRARFVSNGHAGGRWDVDVYVSDAGAEAFRAERGPVPLGTRLVKEHFERSTNRDRDDDGGAPAAGPLMMMEKVAPGFDPEHGDWRYVVVGKSGEVLKDGPISSCAGCHDDAPHDHLFRVVD